MHEPFDYYNDCQTRQRNLGLFTADRVSLGDLPPNGGSATQTRQNNGGTQYGFECPEERDYYPYWRTFQHSSESRHPTLSPVRSGVCVS